MKFKNSNLIIFQNVKFLKSKFSKFQKLKKNAKFEN